MNDPRRGLLVPVLSGAFALLALAAALSAAGEEFPALVERLRGEKPAFAARQRTLLQGRSGPVGIRPSAAAPGRAYPAGDPSKGWSEVPEA